MGKWTDSDKMAAREILDIPPVWLLGALVLVWIQATFLPFWTQGFGVSRMLGIVLIVLGFALMLWAAVVFRAHQTSIVPHQMPARIITKGPFSFSRNPIYLGDVLILTGAVFWWGAWPSLLLIPIFVMILVRRFIAPEEVRMKENFGPEFDDFSKRTRRWL
jgi:protein-S-isoprenylcysteine O-methyltransferase Ste14